ncbi:RICIN domain-containing protein [Streptomyces regalis]|uniref:Ricin B lectin domain-containing protein n=1 Tax=Streptomyces regalis TaxID=68262 RepID=A0A117MRR5_9ACTN|nr:RICIN domain-containing protein [Streptomyces regalis]KUL32152.1 hypothetical protein ADL12_23430 [Streptomyces regalis]
MTGKGVHLPTTQEGARHRVLPRAHAVTLLLALLAAAVAVVLPCVSGKAHAIARATQTMYTSPSSAPSPGALYARALRMHHSGSSDGTMLATFEQYTSGTPVFPIYRSTDGGNSWTQISNIADTHNGSGLRYQPFLYELPTAIGNFPAGTILAAANSIPADLSTTGIDLYASTDHGVTWSFVSEITKGGNAHSNLKLAIAGGSTTNGVFATQQTTDNATDQQWRFALQPSGYFKIFNVATGKVLGVKDQWPGDGSKILQWDDNGTLHHEWAVTPDPAGGFTAVNRLTGKYLEIPNASTAVGQAADQWGYTGCDCQRWNLTQVALPPLGAGQYILVNKNSGKYLDIPGASTTVGQQADQWQNSTCDCQRWTFQSAGGGAWKMKNVHSGLYLDVSGSSTCDGAAVVQNTSSAATSQQWTLTDTGDGWCKLVNAGSGKLADVDQASTANGAPIIQWTDPNGTNQLWKIVRIN